MGGYVLHFDEIDQTRVALVGGKGAHLGELARIEDIRVPAGFCVTTAAFERIMASVAPLDELLDRLTRLEADDAESIRPLTAEIRRMVEAVTIPDDLAAAITQALSRLGEHTACAVRSSATAEDLPTASFAGQQDTYLNVVGRAAILRHVSRCWASLFTDRAVTYRLRNGVDHRKLAMGVVVQRMVYAQASGILFTADPVTGNRNVASVEATFGLGELLVSGRVNGDIYSVRGDEVISRSIAIKTRASYATASGGTEERNIEPEDQQAPALTDAQLARLARLGRRIEAHFGRPQDIEWCLVDDDFQIVQSRPITTLFPIPAADDGENRVYISVGHQQMMTDAMRPLGISVWQLTAGRPMYEAGSRLFVDVTGILASPATRRGFVEGWGKTDPLIRDALQTVLDRGDFIRLLPDADAVTPPTGAAPTASDTDPALVARLIRHAELSIASLKRDIVTKSGPALLELIHSDLLELKRFISDAANHQAIMAGMEATWWLNERLLTWLGEKNAADTLAQSAPNNITSEMGLALLDVADAIRPHPEVVAFLQHVRDDTFLDVLPALPGGQEARGALLGWLERYGMRCVGEIDITRPRWSERPSTLVPLILGNIRNFEPGEAGRRFEQGMEQARQKATELLQRLRTLPDGERKAEETQPMIDRLRTFIGYREYPKYHIVSRYFVYKQALLEEAERLVRERVLREKEDVFFLTFQELHEVLRTERVDHELIRQRRDTFRAHQALQPPRVLTSDGGVITGTYRRDDVPAGALIGLAVSAGTVAGRARVILDMAQADLEAGDILVTRFTDPSWTPVFVAISGLVTEVGGVMTHGAVIAREYGLPAVVGVADATRLIRDGQQVRVHGTEGYVEIVGE